MMASSYGVVADHISVSPTPSNTNNNAEVIFFIHHTLSPDRSQPPADQLGIFSVDRFFYLNREVLSSQDNRYIRFVSTILSSFNFCSEAYCRVFQQLLSLEQNPTAWTGGGIRIVVHERLVEEEPRVINNDEPSGSCFSAEAFLQRLKTKGEDEVGEGEICAVCMDGLRGAKVVVELPCLHLFHRDCVSTWFTRSPTCPICRYNILPNHS